MNWCNTITQNVTILHFYWSPTPGASLIETFSVTYTPRKCHSVLIALQFSVVTSSFSLTFICKITKPALPLLICLACRKKRRNVARRSDARQKRSDSSWRETGKTERPGRRCRGNRGTRRGPVTSSSKSRWQLKEIHTGEDQFAVVPVKNIQVTCPLFSKLSFLK